MNSPRKKVFLLEDHRLVSEGLKLLLEQEPDLEVCGVTGNSVEALSQIEALHPDVILVDISLPGMNGIEFLKSLRDRALGIPAVVLSMHADSVYAERALRAGALGYVMKQEAATVVLAALRKALQGEYFVSGRVAGAVFHKALGTGGSGSKASSPSPAALLSDRELEVFELLGKGKTTRAIADALGISIKTAESHRANIKQKLRLKDVTEMVQHATLWVAHESAGVAG